MENRMIKLYGNKCSVPLRVVQGHFVTNHSHVNYYIDMTSLKSRLSEAGAVAQALCGMYRSAEVIDTILCIDGTQVVGALLAEKMTMAGVRSLNNMHSTIYIATPEYDDNGQMFFRDNIQPMIRGKNVLTLLASVTTGITVRKAAECVSYYGGNPVGFAAIFSTIGESGDLPVHCVFDETVIPDYQSYMPGQCPMCAHHIRIDALVNGFGYSKL